MAYIETRRDAAGRVTGYQVRVTVKGAPRITKTFRRRTDAKEWGAATETRIKEGLHFATSRRTLGEAIDRYLAEELPKLAASERRNRERQLGWWKRRRGFSLLREISRPSVGQDLRHLRQEGMKARPVTVATANRYKAALSALLSYAVEELQWLPQHPLRGGGRRKRPKSEREVERERELAPEEKERLWQACRLSRDFRLYGLVVCAYACGAREDELMGLEWARLQLSPLVFDPELGRRRPGVPKAELMDTKNGESRVVYFPGEAADILREMAKTPRFSRYVFAAESDAPNQRPRFPSGAWRYAKKRARVANFWYHDLRHCWACNLVDAGATLGELITQGGWRDPKMARRYAKRAQREGNLAVERIDRERRARE